MRSQVQAIADEFGRGLRAVLQDKLHAAYIYGAAAFAEDFPTGDIDFHAILNAPLVKNDRVALYLLHSRLEYEYPPLGRDMDGYYISLKDARERTPPRSQMWQRAVDTSWALHREHILAGRVIELHGPDPATVYRPADWAELEAALYSELRYVEDHLRVYPAYCILQLCRLVYSFETQDVVVSKFQALQWGLDSLPEWRELIEAARRSYAGEPDSGDQDRMESRIGAFLTLARGRIGAAGPPAAKA